MSDDVRRRLDEAASRPVPPPDPAFVSDLEARLQAVAASLPSTPPPLPARRGLLPGRRAAGAVLAIAAALAIALGVSSLGHPVPPATASELVEPVNVRVVLADGTVVLEDPDGLLLPEGAVVTVGEGGSGRIGETVLAPGDVATVQGGRLQVERRPAGAVPTPSRTSQPGATLPVTTPTPSPPAATASPAPVRTPGPSPTPTSTPIRTPGSTPRPAVGGPSPTPTRPPATVRPRLRVRLIDGPRIAVTWTETWRAHRYVLLMTASRSGPARDPAYPGARVLGEFAKPPQLPLRYRVPAGVAEVRLMVVALRRDGTVLRRSDVATVKIPPGTSTGTGTGTAPSLAPDPTPSP